ncbi:hypothetical protein ACFPPD_18710 [Cohnella suwonensis]|uniref:Uncharacterized protein n=1 Tax=Cohnella suwonensis TaxID=696072 RepID=A0ABW0M1E1_9BACL
MNKASFRHPEQARVRKARQVKKGAGKTKSSKTESSSVASPRLPGFLLAVQKKWACGNGAASPKYIIEKGGHVSIVTPQDEENMKARLRFHYKARLKNISIQYIYLFCENKVLDRENKILDWQLR